MTTVTRPALLSSVAYIMQAAGITLAELAQHIGQPPLLALPVEAGVDIDAVHRMPSPNKGREPHNKGKRMPLSDAAKRVLELADCEEGATIPDLCAGLGVNDSTVHHHLKRLTEERLITRVKIAGQASPVYFARPAHAAAFAEANAPKSAPTPEPARVALSEAEAKTLQTNAKKRAAAKKSAPPLGARNLTPNANGNPTFMPPRIDGSRPRPSGEAVETEATRRTIDSTQRPTARWQAQQLPADPRWPSFSGTPLGVNPDTGRPWA